MRDKKNNRRGSGFFISSKDIEEQWDIWRQSADRIEDRTIPEKLGQQIMDIAQHLLEHPNFIRYKQDMKEDMQGGAVLKCLRNLKNIDPSKGSLFAYLTMVCWTYYITFLIKYYKDRNRRKQLIIEAMEKAQTNNPNEANKIYIQMLKNELERYSKGNKIDTVDVDD